MCGDSERNLAPDLPTETVTDLARFQPGCLDSWKGLNGYTVAALWLHVL